jgi:inosose dehydratase
MPEAFATTTPPVAPSDARLRFGTAPVNWNNFDLEGWRPEVPFPGILDEMKAAGYVRTEWDVSFGLDPDMLREEADRRGIAFVGAYRWVDFLDDARFERDVEQLRGFLPVLQALGIENLIVADALRPMRVAHAGAIPADGSRSLPPSGYTDIARNLHALSAVASNHGLRVRYHNHAGSWIETPDEVARLIEELDLERVDLCFDTGHYAFGGGDPHKFIDDHGPAIGVLHLKDVDPQILARARQSGWSFRDALRQIIFCPLGEGSARINEMVAVLVDREFAGDIIIEQDTCAGDSTETARLNLDRARAFEESRRASRSDP